MLEAFGVAFLFASIIGPTLALVMPRVTRAVACHFTFPVNWMVLIATMARASRSPRSSCAAATNARFSTPGRSRAACFATASRTSRCSKKSSKTSSSTCGSLGLKFVGNTWVGKDVTAEGLHVRAGLRRRSSSARARVWAASSRLPVEGEETRRAIYTGDGLPRARQPQRPELPAKQREPPRRGRQRGGDWRRRHLDGLRAHGGAARRRKTSPASTAAPSRRCSAGPRSARTRARRACDFAVPDDTAALHGRATATSRGSSASAWRSASRTIGAAAARAGARLGVRPRRPARWRLRSGYNADPDLDARRRGATPTAGT